MIIRSSQELKERYQDLCSGDIFLGILSYKHIKQSILIDLMERGVSCFPSPLSQILNQSKTTQAVVLNKWMLPHTCVITRRRDLIETINTYTKLDIAPVVTKEDHMHCGHGVRKWDTIETLYNYMALSESSYPFVIQPFLDNFTDVRVIIAGRGGAATGWPGDAGNHACGVRRTDRAHCAAHACGQQARNARRQTHP